MKCPIDNTTLAISERQGIEVDYCPECRQTTLQEKTSRIVPGGFVRLLIISKYL